MKKIIRNLLVILAVSPFLIQCASQNEVTQLNYQLRVVNKKLEDMKKGTVGQMQKRQAASSSQIDQLNREVNVLKGQLDETAHLNRTLKEQNKELESSIRLLSERSQLEKEEALKQTEERERIKNEQLAELARRLEQQQASVKAIQSARVKEAERKARKAARAAAAARKKARQASSSIGSGSGNSIPVITATKTKIKRDVRRSQTKVATAQSTATPTSRKPASQKPAPTTTQVAAQGGLFPQAKAQYDNGNFKVAFKKFEQYVEKNPNGNKYIEARYLMGECLYWQKQYDQAILQYQKIISNHPKHKKTPSALLRQGLAFENLSDYETAKIIYRKLTTSYGSSPEAKTASERAANL